MRRRLASGLLLVMLSVGAAAGSSWTLVHRGGIPLDGRTAWAVYALTETAGARFVPLLLAFGLVLWATDPGVERRRRHRQSLVLFVIMLVVLPLAGALNEYVLKPAIAIPRPSQLRLHEAGIIPDLEAFERLPPHARRDFLASRLSGDAGREAAAALRVQPLVLQHWAREVGSTFPSGHALNAFIAAVLFVGGACAEPTRRRRSFAGAWLVWSIGVAESRCLLFVHRPADVAAGALAGAAAGGLALLVWWRWAVRPDTLPDRL